MERRIKNVYTKFNINNLQMESKIAAKEKKFKKSDTFKQMKRRISSSFGKLNVIKDDLNKDGISQPSSQKRCYSSTEIHDVNYTSKTPTKSSNTSISGSISFFQRAFCHHTQKDPGENCNTTSQHGIFKNLWKRSTVKRHRSLGNVNSVSGENHECDIVDICQMNPNESATTALCDDNSVNAHKNKKTTEINLKQGPAAKISAKIRSRRGNSSKLSTEKSTESMKCKSEIRPHSISRTMDDDRTNSIVESAVHLTLSNYHQKNVKDIMSTSLNLTRPKSDGHCFENILNTSITETITNDKFGSKWPEVPRKVKDNAKSNSQHHRAWRNRRLTSASGVESGSPKLYGPSPHLFGKSDSYQKLDMLGEGSYATVFKGYSNLTNQTVALKEIRINSEEGVPFTAIREASLLKNLRHANIVILHDIVHAKETLTFVFEYVHSDLSKYIERHPHGIKPHNIKLFLFQLLRGLGFCHERRILHRDLKPQNLLISEIGELKLADFGLARAKSVPSRTYSNEVVTLWYRPPDVLLGSTDYNAALDMWGVGCIFVEMIGGSAIFPGLKDTDDQLEKIFKVMGSPNEKVWPGVSTLPNYQLFIMNRGNVCYKGRPLHRHVQRLFTIPHAESLALAFLQIRPELRVLTRAAMSHPYFDDLSKQLLYLPHNMSVFSVPGVRMMPESPFQITNLNNYKHLYYRKFPSNHRHSSCEKASPEPEQISSNSGKSLNKNDLKSAAEFSFDGFVQ